MSGLQVLPSDPLVNGFKSRYHALRPTGEWVETHWRVGPTHRRLTHHRYNYSNLNWKYLLLMTLKQGTSALNCDRLGKLRRK